jgi:hypothetical protein
MSEHVEQCEALTDEELDLSQYEAEFVVESDGLTIAAYCDHDDYVLDFDWEDGSKWEPLNDPELFEEFTANLLTRLTGEVEVNPADVLDDLLQGDGGEAEACAV